MMIDVRRAGADDAEIAAAVIAEYLTTIRDTVMRDDVDAEVARHLADARSAVFLGVAGADVMGCVAVHPYEELSGAFEIKRLYVRPAGRRQGLAVRLMEAAEAHARRAGAARVILDTKPSMRAAIALYESLGYRRIPAYQNEPDCHVHYGKPLEGEL